MIRMPGLHWDHQQSEGSPLYETYDRCDRLTRLSEDGHVPEYESAIDLMVHPSLCVKYMEHDSNPQTCVSSPRSYACRSFMGPRP